MIGRKALVLLTAAVAFSSLSAAAVYRALRLPAPIVLKIEGCPMIGKSDAKVELALFEDFCCSNCCAFSQTVFPEIAHHYLETGRARCAWIPLAFIQGSKPFANAALGVYRQAPERFFPFICEIFSHFRGRAANEAEILEVARKVGGIDLAQLEACVKNRSFYEELDKNLHWARRLMGRQFGIPALYVNGIPTSTASFQEVAKRIERLERKK